MLWGIDWFNLHDCCITLCTFQNADMALDVAEQYDDDGDDGDGD